MNVFYQKDIDINKKYCCYQTTNLINGKYYRGKALTENVLIEFNKQIEDYPNVF